MEPAGTGRIENITDTVSGSISWIKGAFIVGLQPEFSRTDDKTAANLDTQSQTMTVFSSYGNEKFSISPSVSANRFEDENRSVDRETVSGNLSFSAHLAKRLTLDGAASYGVLNASDDSVDQDTFSGDLQLSYTWDKWFTHIVSPSVQLRASHDNTSDKVADTGTKETIIYLVFSAGLDLSF